MKVYANNKFLTDCAKVENKLGPDGTTYSILTSINGVEYLQYSKGFYNSRLNSYFFDCGKTFTSYVIEHSIKEKQKKLMERL